jgi:GntR family transcriptional regulator
MQITIDIDSAEPLFEQLIIQIKALVLNDGIEGLEGLSAGSALPSIRQLANELDINHKTVAKAYRLLERDSVIQTKGYRGTFIHPEAKTNCTVDLNGWVKTRLSETIAAFKASGVTDSEIRKAFTDVMNNH